MNRVILNNSLIFFKFSVKVVYVLSKIMAKKDIHPKYYPKAKVRCSCGNEFVVGSTKPEIEIEVCSKCHPFFTGQDKVIDTMGQIQKFKKKLEKHAEIKRKKKK
jgi:large subunit ribosomal protein L31